MKIILTGDGATGKTSLRLRYMGLKFKSQYLMSIGADFALKEIQIQKGIHTGKYLKCQIWDLAGQPMFKRVRSLYYSGSHGAFLVYDVTRPETFENIINWLEEILRASGDPIPVILVANKIDLRPHVDHAISKKLGEELAKQISIHFLKNKMSVPLIETSAKTGENVQFGFQKLAEIVIDYFS
ncbi:MAG: Rab family GTPase [Candidatus Hodarchaeales archaeon]|jgi:small GTP-binding protein